MHPTKDNFRIGKRISQNGKRRISRTRKKKQQQLYVGARRTLPARVGASSRQQPIRQLNEAKCRPWFGAESVNKVETKSRTLHRKSRKFSQEEFRCLATWKGGLIIGVSLAWFERRLCEESFRLRSIGQDRLTSSRENCEQLPSCC